MSDLPGQNQSPGRLPNEDRSPIAFCAVFLLRITATAGPAFDDGFGHRRLADMMRARPPGVIFRGERLKRTLDRCFNRDTFPYRSDAGRIDDVHASSSIFCLNANSASDQN